MLTPSTQDQQPPFDTYTKINSHSHLPQHLLLTQIISTSHSLRHTLKPVCILKSSLTIIDLSASLDCSYGYEYSCTQPHMNKQKHTWILKLQHCDAQSGHKWGKMMGLVGLLLWFFSSRTKPKHPRVRFLCNNCGELLWLLFNQARETLI